MRSPLHYCCSRPINGQNWSKRRKPTVQNKMGLLNSGTLNRGRNLCVTAAIDHLTVDGFHDELQLSAKNTKGKALQRISWVKEFLFGSLEWISLQCSVSPTEILPIREHGITRNTPRIRLVRGRRSLERNSSGSVRIPQHKAQREGDDFAQIGDNSQKTQMDN